MKELLLYIYGNSACAERRRTDVDDCNDYYEVDVSVNNGKDLLLNLYGIVWGYSDEDLAIEREELDEDISIEQAISDFSSRQDWGDGSAILYAIYDLTKDKYLLGDKNSKRELLTEYISVEEYEEEGYDFEELACMMD